MVASGDDAREDLFRYFQDFVRCIHDSQEELKTALAPESRAKARARSVSGLMNDFVTHRLRDCFTGRPGVTLDEKYGQTKLIFNCQYVMKCKKSTGRKLSYVDTQLMLSFMHQSRLPGMPSPVTNVILTYEWNRPRTEIVKIALLCPANKNNYHWEIPLAKAAEFLPVQEKQEIPSEPPLETKRVKPKAKKAKETKKKRQAKKNEQAGKEHKPRNGGVG